MDLPLPGISSYAYLFIAEPAELPDRFARAVAAGNVDAVVNLFDPEGVIVPFDPAATDGLISGAAEIRATSSKFLELAHRHLEWLGPLHLVVGRDTALMQCAWRLTSTLEDGSTQTTEGTSSDVARWKARGGWRYLIRQPGGLEAVQAHRPPQ